MPSRQFMSILLAFLGGVTPLAAQPTIPPSVLVDFYVVREDGRPIRDLRPEEVIIRVDGRPRAVQSLRQMAMADPPSDDPARPVPPPPPFGTNVVEASARTLILVLDDDSFRPGREHPLRESVGQFLVELSAQDRVALVTVPYGGLKVDFTAERERITQALSKIVGQAPPNQSGSDFACRTRRTLESLTGLLDSLSGGEGPTTVLFFSSGLAGPRRDAPITRAPGPCELTTEDFRKVGVASSAARAHFYVIMPDPVMMRAERAVENIAGVGFIGSDNPLEGLEHLAGVTGGQLVDLTATGRNILSRVSRETSSYYVAALAPDASDRAGSRHQLEVRVTRPDTTVRSRPELTMPRTDTRPSRKTKSPREMLREPAATRDLPLRGIGYVAQNQGDDRLKIVVIMEPVDPPSGLRRRPPP